MTDHPADLESAVQLRDYWRILRRRWRVIAIASLIGLGGAFGYVITAHRVYESNARLLIEDGSRTYTRADPSQPFGDVLALPGHDVLTQMEVLRGDDLQREALRKAQVPPDAVKISVARVFDTDVVSVAIRSSRPEYARRVAETLPQVFIAHGAAVSQQEIAGASRFARARLAAVNRQLAEAELSLQTFRDREGVTDLAQQRTTGITAARAAASDTVRLQQDIQGLTAQLTTLKAYRASLPRVSRTPETVTNPNLAALKASIAALENDRARVAVLYKENNTRVQELDAQIGSLRRQLAAEPPTITTETTRPNTVAAAYDRQVADLRATLASKRNELGAIRDARTALDKDLARYAALARREAGLQRAVDQHQAAAAMLTTNLEVLGIREKATRAPASLVSAAGPARLVAPRTPSALAAGLLGGLLLGIVLALVTDHLDERVYTEGDARRLLGSPVLGLIPRTGHGSASPEAAGALQESFRVLRANLQCASPERPTRSILVTSTMAGEGKTFTARNLAEAIARGGRRVVLVDADLQRSATPGGDACAGLADVLRGRCDLKAALHPTHLPGLSILPSGSDPAEAVEALTGAAAEALVRHLHGLCDFVVMDAPPLLESADALVLSSLVDGVLYVVGVGGPSKPMLALAEQMLSNAHARVMGVALNRVDPAPPRYAVYRRREEYAGIPMKVGAGGTRTGENGLSPSPQSLRPSVCEEET